MTIFVTGKLANPLNNSHGHWFKHARTARSWRERTAHAVLEYVLTHGGTAARPPAAAPKRVRFRAHTWNIWDADEGLNAACKPIRDGLVDAGVLHSDAADSGHQWIYGQVMDRAHRGVEITVELL